MPRFVDTNVLLYAISDDPADSAHQQRASDILCARDLILSTQVLGEFYVQATRPSRPHPWSHDDAVAFIAGLRRYPIQAVTVDAVSAALVTEARYQLSYWDALILETARRSGCQEVLSGDLSSEQDYGGLAVTNPFLAP